MAQFTADSEHYEREAAVTNVGDPIPVGMSAFAFTTVIIGCVYAGFILPGVGKGISLAVAAALLYGGLIQILAGMWEFKKNNTLAATIFTSYGGFLAAFGIVFLPAFGIERSLVASGSLTPALGLFFLCWTIFTGLLFIGSLRTSIAMELVLILMFVSFLLLTIGELGGVNTTLLIIGGWFGIVSGLVAWYVALADMLRAGNGPFQLPMGWIK
jgi:succinate-acetate transporter protein